MPISRLCVLLATVVLMMCIGASHAHSPWRTGSERGFSAGYPRICGYMPPDAPPAFPDITLPVGATSATLEQVVVTMRHGSRTIGSGGFCWHNDTAVWDCNMAMASMPNFDRHSYTTERPGRLYRTKFMPGHQEYAGNCMTGQLTEDGFKQHMHNGQTFRKMYIESDNPLLGPDFNRSHIFLRSDLVERTIFSAQGFMDGMFPNDEPSSQASLLDIHTMDKPYDDISPNGNLCPLLKQYDTLSKQTPEYLQHFQDITVPLLTRLSEELHYNVTIDHLDQLHDCADTHLCNGFPIPISPALYGELCLEMNYQWSLAYSYPSRTLAAQAGIGFLLDDILRFQTVVAEDGAEASDEAETDGKFKFVLLSGHDGTVMPLLAALGTWDPPIWCPLAFTATFELYTLLPSGEKAVRLVYNNKEQLMDGCSSTLCPWVEYKAAVTALTPPEDWRYVCHSPPNVPAFPH